MNILRKYTRRSLAANRSRTLVTIIGIILSMGLLTAVIEGANSGVQFMVRGEAARNGSWELFAYDTDEARLEGLMSDPEIGEAAAWKNVGFDVAFPKSFSDPYLVIQSISDDMSELLPLRIVSGRMPQNDSEIVIPHNMP